MDWKEKLGIEQKETPEENAKYIFDKQIDEYFLDLGFYEYKMNPRFMDGYDYEKLTHDAPVLRFDGDWDRGGTQRVFMNTNEIYVERQTNYRSFDGSDYHKFENPPTSIQEIEEVLQKLIKEYE